MGLSGWWNSAGCVLILAGVMTSVVYGYSNGPPDGRTGAPGESTCMMCHANGADDGSMGISGIPSTYTSGQPYVVTVQLEDSGQSRWGFELTVLNEQNQKAGDLFVTQPDYTQLSSSGDREYIKQTSEGTYSGTADGPVSWRFNWVAPARSNGVITFYAAGNAADNDNGTAGDNVYTTLTTIDPATDPTFTPFPPTSTPMPPTITPTFTPTPIPTVSTPTPTVPPCTSGGVTLDMPADYFSPGDLCYLKAFVCNPSAQELNENPLFVILDVYGAYFFAPKWVSALEGIDYYEYDWQPGNTEVTVIFQFEWPENTGRASGVIFWSALTDRDITEIWGELDHIEFGWGD